MPDSLQEQSARDALLQARTPRTKQVMVDGSPVPILTPFPSPIDWRDHWIYFLMTDRFNNPNAAPKHPPFDQPIAAFQGGTFKGIQAQLAYVKNLGAGAIWITPPFKNKQRLDGQVNEGRPITVTASSTSSKSIRTSVRKVI